MATVPDNFDADRAVSNYLTISRDDNSLSPANAMRSVVPQAATRNPEDEASIKALSDDTGIPFESLRDAEIRKQAETTRKLQQFDYDRYAATAPSSARLLSNPNTAGMVFDDANTMSGAENLLRGIGDRTVKSTANVLLFGMKALDPIGDYLEEKIPLGRLDFSDGSLTWRPTTAEDLQRNKEDGALGMEAALNEVRRLGLNAASGDTTRQYKPMTDIEDLKAAPLKNFIPFALEQGIVSLPDMVWALTNPVAYGAGLTEDIAQARAENDGRSNTDLTFGDYAAAAPVATVSALLERFGAQSVFGIDATTDSFKQLGKNVLRSAAVEGATETIQESLQYLGGTLGTEKGANLGELGDSALGGFVGGTGFGGTVRTGTASIELMAHRAQDKTRKAIDGETNAAMLDQLKDTVQSMKLLERDQKTAKQWVEEITEDSNASDIYIDPEELAQSGIDRDTLAELSPSAYKQMNTGVDGQGGYIKIPLSEFVTNIAPNDEFAQQLIDIAKIDPNDMSRREARDFVENNLERLQQEVEAEIERSDKLEELHKSRQVVEENILKQLRKTNRFNDGTNRAYATLQGHFFETMGRRVGKTAEELYDQFSLKVRPGTTDARSLSQKATETPTFKKWFGESAIRNEDGSPMVVYHGTGATDLKDFAFDYTRIGEQGRSEGAGFYFTNNKDIASGYGQDGTVIESYLAINNPMTDKQPAFDFDKMKEILRRVAEKEAADNDMEVADGFLSNYGDARYDGVDAVLDEATDNLMSNETALDQISDLVSQNIDIRTVNEAVREVTGHDGVKIDKAEWGEQSIYVAFFPEQVKSVDNIGTFDPTDERILYQKVEQAQKNDLNLYSALEAEVLNMNLPNWKPKAKDALSEEEQARLDELKVADDIFSTKDERYIELQQLREREREAQGAATGKEIWQKISSLQVKQEEIEWLGIEEFLKASTRKLTRQDVVDFIRENGVRIEEIYADQKGGDEDFELDFGEGEVLEGREYWEHRIEDLLDMNEEEYRDAAIEEIINDEVSYIQSSSGIDGIDEMDADDMLDSVEVIEWVSENFLNEIQNKSYEKAEQDAEQEYMDDPQYRWTAETPDGPDIIIEGNDDFGYAAWEDSVNGRSIFGYGDVYSFNEAELQAISHARDYGYVGDASGPEIAKWEDYVTKGDYENYREIKLTLPDLEGDFYNEVHFEDRNIVAFLRVDDRQATPINALFETLKRLPKELPDDFGIPNGNGDLIPASDVRQYVAEVDETISNGIKQLVGAMGEKLGQDFTPEGLSAIEAELRKIDINDEATFNHDAEAKVSDVALENLQADENGVTLFPENFKFYVTRIFNTARRVHTLKQELPVYEKLWQERSEESASLKLDYVKRNGKALDLSDVEDIKTDVQIKLEEELARDYSEERMAELETKSKNALLKLYEIAGQEPDPVRVGDFSAWGSAASTLARDIENKAYEEQQTASRRYEDAVDAGAPTSVTAELSRKSQDAYFNNGKLRDEVHELKMDAAAYQANLQAKKQVEYEIGRQNDMNNRRSEKLRRAGLGPQSMYFVDEFQSDWHQDGRQKGYQTGEIDAGELEQEVYKIREERTALVDSFMDYLNERFGYEGGSAAGQTYSFAALMQAGEDIPNETINARTAEYQNAKILVDSGDGVFQEHLKQKGELNKKEKEIEAQVEAERYGVPNAPFKGDNWIALGLKRALIQAAEGDYKIFGWPDADVLSSRWSEQYRKLYETQYDTKMPSIVKKLTKQKPVKLEHPDGYSYWSIEMTPELREQILGEGFALFQKQRGSYSPETMTIKLTEAADLSTFLHESGHFYLETLGTMAADPGAPKDIKDDMNKVLKYLGVKDMNEWMSKDLEAKRDAHEKFARAFEAYLFSGKSPSAELQPLFKRFSRWLKDIYKKLRNLDAPLTADIRGVFDRMLASDDAIAEMEFARGMMPLFASAEEAGMTPEEWKSYQALGAKASAEASEELSARTLRDMKWLSNARNRELKKLQKQANAKRSEIRAEVEDEIMRERSYQARRFITHGEFVVELDEDANKTQRRLATQAASASGAMTKMSLKSLEDFYGKDDTIWQDLPKGKYGWVSKDGMDFNDIAQLFGYGSGDQMLQDLLRMEDPKERIDAITDRRMLEEYGDLTNPETLERAADEAIHNDLRARFISAEMNALSKATGEKQKILLPAAKEAAASIISRLRIRDIRPSRYTAAEAKEARLADQARKKGELNRAAIHKRNQLIQNQTAKAALEAQERTEKQIQYLKKFMKEGVRKNVDIEYLDHIDALLERFDLRKGTTLKALDRRKSLSDWIASQQELGLEPDIPPAMQDELYRKHYKNMTVDELANLVDTVKQIEHLGRLKNKLLTLQDKRQFDQVVADIVESIDRNKPNKLDNTTRATAQQRAEKFFRGYAAQHRKAASIVRELDGDVDGGAFWEAFVRSMNVAGDKEARMRADAAKHLAEISSKIRSLGKMNGQGVFVEALGRNMNREERIGLVLNMGNEGNLQRMQDGNKYSDAQLQAVLDMMSKEELDFIQEVWDMFEQYRPMVAEQERRLYGKEPEWVEPTPLVTKFGTYRGGYYPIKYDLARSARAAQDEEAEMQKRKLSGAYTAVTTRRTFTKARADSVVDRPVLLTMDGIFSGLNEVIHSLSWQDWIVDANRIIRDKHISKAILEAKGDLMYSQMKEHIRAIGEGEMAWSGKLENALRHVRVGMSIARLGFSISTAMINVSGLTQSVVRVGPQNMLKGLGQFVSNPKKLKEEVHAKSDFMALRAQTQFRELNEIRSVLQDKTKFREWMDTYTFVPSIYTQMAVDLPTWKAAYDQHIINGETEERAIALADQTVLDTQSGGQVKDLAAVQRGELTKMLTVFYTYFSATWQLTAEATNKTNFKDPGQVLNLMGTYLMLYTVPSILTVAIRDVIISGLKGEDDWDDPEAIAKAYANEQIGFVLAPLVGIREIAPMVQQAAGTTDFHTSYSGPAGFGFYKDLERTIQQLSQGEMDEALLKATANLLGVTTHLPSVQFNRFIDGVNALRDGETSSPAALIFGGPSK